MATRVNWGHIQKTAGNHATKKKKKQIKKNLPKKGLQTVCRQNTGDNYPQGPGVIENYSRVPKPYKTKVFRIAMAKTL